MDIENTMRFILDMQAKHEVVIQQWDERFTVFQERFTGFQERFTRFQEHTEERFRSLVDVSLSFANNLQTLTHGLEETNASVRALRESQAHTDRRLDAVIDIVGGTERRLSELAKIVEKLVKHNGRGK